MQHSDIEAAFDLPDLTGSVRNALGQIVTGIDARFVQVGTTLAGTVEAIDLVVAALQDVGTVFQQGDAAAAVENLTRAAQRLFDVSDQVADRTAEVGCIRKASYQLGKDVAEVRKTLNVLLIYGMNVKIAASGAQDFVDFADRMRVQLEAGETEIAGFDVKLEDLEVSLAGMVQSDKLLAAECAHVVPQVPQQLMADARALHGHQGKLVDLAETAKQLARTIQGDVAAVLGAVQIGDIARQRLEHVLSGCLLLEAYLAAPDGDPAEQAATRHLILSMFVAQLIDTVTDFRRETQILVSSLRNLGPQAARLLALQTPAESADDGQIFLRQLESGIADAAKMIAQLQRADCQAEETLGIIVDTVDDLSVRAAAIRNLRIDVQQMAINIGLRCRRVEQIGRPVTVIANEIRRYSDKLDETIDGITHAADELNVISLRMRERGDARDVGTGNELSSSLEAIREGARSTERAMATAGQQAGGILGMLRQTTDDLQAGLDLGGTIDALAEQLAEIAGTPVPVDETPDHPVRSLLTEIARSYTMAQERVVHDQFRLSDMAALVSAAPVATSTGFTDGDDDDDALFDDALF